MADFGPVETPGATIHTVNKPENRLYHFRSVAVANRVLTFCKHYTNKDGSIRVRCSQCLSANYARKLAKLPLRKIGTAKINRGRWVQYDPEAGHCCLDVDAAELSVKLPVFVDYHANNVLGSPGPEPVIPAPDQGLRGQGPPGPPTTARIPAKASRVVIDHSPAAVAAIQYKRRAIIEQKVAPKRPHMAYNSIQNRINEDHLHQPEVAQEIQMKMGQYRTMRRALQRAKANNNNQTVPPTTAAHNLSNADGTIAASAAIEVSPVVAKVEPVVEARTIKSEPSTSYYDVEIPPHQYAIIDQQLHLPKLPSPEAAPLLRLAQDTDKSYSQPPTLHFTNGLISIKPESELFDSNLQQQISPKFNDSIGIAPKLPKSGTFEQNFIKREAADVI